MIRNNQRTVRLGDLLADLPECGRSVRLARCRVSLVGLVKAQFNKIEQLDIANNLLQRLDGIEQLAHLKFLDLRSNKIADQREILKLAKCKHLRKVCLQGNPFAARQLIPAVKDYLEQLDHDLPIRTIEGSSETHSRHVTIEEQMADNYVEECFLESVFRKLDLHTEFTNEFTVQDYSQKDYAWLIKNRNRFMPHVGFLRAEYIDIAREQAAELHRRYPANTQAVCEQLLCQQRERIQELTALILKKSEILRNLRMVGEKNLQFTLSQESGSHSTLQVYIEDQEQSRKRIEPVPLVNKRVLAERHQNQNFSSLSESNFRSKGGQLQYRMINSQLTSDSNIENIQNEWKMVRQRNIFAPKPVQTQNKKQPTKQKRPSPIKSQEPNSRLKEVEVNISTSHKNDDRLQELQQLLAEQKSKLTDKERELCRVQLQLQEKSSEIMMLSEKCKLKEEKVKELSENLQMVHQISQNNESDYQEVIEGQQSALMRLKEEKEQAEASVSALIATEKNEQILMLAKQAELKRRYFDLIVREAQRLQTVNTRCKKNNTHLNHKLRRKVFDVLLTNLIVKRMHDSQLNKMDTQRLGKAFQGLKCNTELATKHNQLVSLRRLWNSQRLLRKLVVRKAPITGQIDRRKELRSFTLKSYSMDALKLHAHEQAARCDQLTNILSLQLNSYRAASFLWSMSQSFYNTRRIVDAQALLAYFLKANRLGQLQTGVRILRPLLTAWSSKLRRISSKLSLKRCTTMVKKQQLQLIVKRKAIAAFALRLCQQPIALQHPAKLLGQFLQRSRARGFLECLIYKHQNNPSRKIGVFRSRVQKRRNTILLQRVVSVWECEVWKQKHSIEADKVQNIQPLMTELRERQLRILKLQAKWKDQLQKKDQRIGLYEKKFEQVSYDIIEKDLRYEKLKAIYENSLHEMQEREAEFMNIINKFQTAEEATAVALRNRRIYEQAVFHTSPTEGTHVQVSEFSLSKRKFDRT